MDDFNFWWYIIAAVIYFLTRKKKKQSQSKPKPNTENIPTPKSPPRSFEELLQEITEGRVTKKAEQGATEIDKKKEESLASPEKLTGSESHERRVFADDESKRVYDESIKMAEGAVIDFERDDNFKVTKISTIHSGDKKSTSYAEELMDGFNIDEAKKAIIYNEIFSRKY